MEEKNVTTGKIDKEVLDIMKEEDVLAAISDDKQCKRLILNCFCEFLGEVIELRKEFDEFNQLLSICSADKLQNFFKELDKNVAEEEKRVNVKKKVEQSHKKSVKKSKKNVL